MEKVGNINSTNEIMTRLGSIFADVDVSHSLTIQYSRKIVPLAPEVATNFVEIGKTSREKNHLVYFIHAFEYAEIFS